MRWSISERQEFRVPLTLPYPHPILDVVPTRVSKSVCVGAGLGGLCWSSVAVTDGKPKAKPAIALPNPTTPGVLFTMQRGVPSAAFAGLP